MMMLEPVSQVNESNYSRLGNQLVGESYASRMARVRRQAGASEPTLGAARPLGTLDPTYGVSSFKQVTGPIYGVMAGATAGAAIGIVGNAMQWESGKTAMAAIVAGSTVALAAPGAYGAVYQSEMGLAGRVLTSITVASGAFMALSVMGQGKWAEKTMGDIFQRDNLGSVVGTGIAALAATAGLIGATALSSKGTFMNAMFTAAPIALVAGMVAGFSHGAVRRSDVSETIRASGLSDLNFTEWQW